MSTPSLSIATLPRVSASTLRGLLSSPASSSSLAIVDVRDADHVGGHIKSSIHSPSTTLDYKVPELVRTLKDKRTVIFHCMLSQQRGPAAALRYARERSRLLGEHGKVLQAIPETEEDDRNVQEDGQAVLVLSGGFDAWQQRYVFFSWPRGPGLIRRSYGEDSELTEAYDKELWQSGMP